MRVRSQESGLGIYKSQSTRIVPIQQRATAVNGCKRSSQFAKPNAQSRQLSGDTQ